MPYDNADRFYRLTIELLLRASGEPSSLMAAVRNEVQSLDRDMPIGMKLTLAGSPD